MLSITWYMTTMKKTVRFHLRKNKTQTKCACGYCVFVHRLMHWNIYGMFCIIRMIDFILESILMWFMFLLRALEAKNVFFLWVFTYFELIFFWFSMHRRRVRERETSNTWKISISIGIFCLHWFTLFKYLETESWRAYVRILALGRWHDLLIKCHIIRMATA